KGISEWIQVWQAKNWKTANKKPVKNIDLWQALVALNSRHTVEWVWVRGHTGDVGNERADALANRGVQQILEQQPT
ncbi:MAG: ribonuclease HI, partial [Methylophilaceae bacterium]|nr:ribonuclease HI [Methylophilaceae bacterium]